MTMLTDVYKLIALRAIRSFLIVMPIIVLYWQSFGFTIQDIFWLQVIFSVAVVVLEIPSGYFADWFGRKNALVIGTIFTTAGYLGYYLAEGFWGFVVAELLLAVSISFVSGANEALLFQTLKQQAREWLYQKYQGRLLSVSTISEATAAVLAGVMASQLGFSNLMLLQVFVMAFSIGIAFSLTTEVRAATHKTPALLAIMKGALWQNSRLRYLNFYSGAIGAATLTMVWLVQPHWSLIGVDVLYFGYLWAGLNLVVALGATLSHRLESWFRFRIIFGLFAVLPLVLFGLMALFHDSLWALAVVPFFWLLRGLKTPIVQDYVQREARDEDRATILSINNLFNRVFFAVFSPFIGWVADAWSFEQAFLAAALIFGTLTLVSFALLYAAMITRPTARA